MSYYILAKQLNGELISVSTEPITAGEGEVLKVRDGEIPDLTKFTWHGPSLAFIENDVRRYCTQEAFAKRLTQDELRGIYTMAESNIDVKIFLDRYKWCQELNLDDPAFVAGVRAMFPPERAEELLS
jgi:hypothetical protein